MDPIADYLKARGKAPLDVGADLSEALDLLAATGAKIDAVLVQAERVKGDATRPDVGRFEQTAQTLDALSRELWKAHSHTLTAINALKQLTDVEAALAS